MQAEHLEVLLEPLGRHVCSYYGNQGGGSLPKDTSVAVCTIEKANSLVNRMLEEGRLSEIGIVVIDELHMVCLIICWWHCYILLWMIYMLTCPLSFPCSFQVILSSFAP